MLDFFRRRGATPESPEVKVCSLDRALEMNQVIENTTLRELIAQYRQIQFGIRMGGQIGSDQLLLSRLAERIHAVLLNHCHIELAVDASIDAFVEGFPNTDAFIV